MKRLGSLRFDGVLGLAERNEVARLLSSSGIAVASWTQSRSGERTYAALRLPEGSAAVPAVAGPMGSAPFTRARFAEPPPLAFEVVPQDRATLAALRDAFSGPGRAAVVQDVCPASESLLVELAPEASLRLVLDIVDGVLARAPARSIVPLLTLLDAALAALAAATLGVADLSATRIIEYYSDQLLAGGRT